MNKLEVALTKELCIICTEEQSGPLLLNTKLTEQEAKKVKKMGNQVIGFADKPCKKCQKMMDEAFIFVGFDEEKSDMENLPYGFYRSGHIVGTKKDIPLVQEWVKDNIPNAIEQGFCFLPHIVMKNIGLIKNLEKCK